MVAVKSPSNPARRLFHAAATIILPTLSFFLPRPAFLILAWAALLAFLVLEVVRFASPSVNSRFTKVFRPVLRAREEKGPHAAVYVLISTVVCFWVFPQPVAAAALFFLALGDASAGLVGERWGRVRIGNKSLEGTLSFFAASLAAGFLLRAAAVPLPGATIALGAFVAAAVELLPLPWDDNLTVPIAAGLAMALLPS